LNIKVIWKNCNWTKKDQAIVGRKGHKSKIGRFLGEF